MAHNPKLEVFVISLNPTTERDVTFRDFYRTKFSIKDSVDDENLFSEYFKQFISAVDSEDFFEDEKNHKAFTAYDTRKDKNNPLNNTIRRYSKSHIIEGIVEGGRYGQTRNTANLSNKNKKGKLGTRDIVLDQFYFLLFTPLNNDKGIFMLQSYTEDSIRDVFSNFLKPFFSAKGFYNIKIDIYTPKQYVDEFKNKSVLKGITYTKNLLVGHIGEQNEEDIEEFTIRIEVKPPKKIEKNTNTVSLGKIKNWIEKFNPLTFKDNKLEDFSKRIYLGNAQTDKAAYYDLEKDLDSIKPTIYLENRIIIDNNGIPDFAELKKYSLELLDTLKNEISVINRVNEC